MRGWRIGVDSGGTFTDIALVEEATGRVAVWKVPSTPDDPSRAIADGVAEGLATAAGATPAAATYFGHGTTVATNALIQGRGARVGLVTTDGFRDLLEIGRQRRPHLYDLQADKPPLLVPRDLRLEVVERLRHDGRIEKPLDEAGVRRAAGRLRAAEVEAVAVCFLYAYLDPRHEARARDILAEELPGCFVTASHEVAPEFREFERLTTTVVNAYLGPVLARYVARLGPRLDAIGIKGPRHITQSNGGVISLATAERQAVRTVLSGPATGVVGATHVGSLAGYPSLITFDMGGTSTDVALIEGGTARLAPEMEVHGYPLKTPMLDIHTVGAGGGSIAHLDAGGHLKVGPQSAGSVPGPVCYGQGGSAPTVTDANVVLGILDQRHLLGGRMAIDAAKARAAIEGLAHRLGLGLMETAQGVVSVVTSNMAKAIRLVSVQRGHDPRGYTLAAFGGAGPLHAARLARDLAIPRVLVPRNPGILCALGLLLADLKTNFAQTRQMPLEAAAAAAMAEVWSGLEGRAEAWFREEGTAGAARRIVRSVDMRYAGQNYELTVAWPAAAAAADVAAALRAGFEAQHRQMYGYSAPEEPIQVVAFRLEATGAVGRVALERRPPASGPVGAAQVATRRAWLPEAGGAVTVPVLDRERLGPGHVIAGPAVIDQMDATTLVLPGQRATVDPWLNLLIEG